MVLSTAQRVLGNRQDAEDAFQATIIALAKSANFSLGSVKGFQYRDVSVRAQARLKAGDSVGLIARRPGDQTRSDYIGQVTADGRDILFSDTSGWVNVPPVQTSLDVLENDVMMQLEVVSDTIRFWAWPAGEEMPAAS